jgi:hypothetical protein
MASGHVNRIYGPNTWPTNAANLKKILANLEPSTQGTFRTCRVGLAMSVPGGRPDRKWCVNGQNDTIDPTRASAWPDGNMRLSPI